ncbi:MAG: TldD/PmbA family protein [Candidatus Thorarchaeota archaeon]
MRDKLRALLEKAPDGVHLEIRYHQRKSSQVRVDKGEIHTASSDDYGGVGIRALVDGAWGYASTSNLAKEVLEKSLNDAINAAKRLAPGVKEKIVLAPIKPITGEFSNLGKDPMENHDFEERVKLIVHIDKMLREADKRIKGSMVRLVVPANHRIILNSDGTDIEIKDTRPDIIIRPVATEGSKMAEFYEGVGFTGGWEIFERKTPEYMVERAVEIATKLLDAPLAKGGKHRVVMEPSLTGIICHEAIGHTVEADIAHSGSAAKGMIGKQVASEHVTMVDSGEERAAGGWLIADDAGVPAKRTTIIEEGILKSYLHSRSTAYIYDVEPTGNERAFEYDVEPIIRMRNTYLTPGEFSRNELIEDIKEGYLLSSAGGGQADSTAEFMFSVPEAYEIKNGEVQGLVRNVTISGNAYEVLSSVDGVSKEWKLDMGWGYCGKGQPARVDGGGGLTRATALVSGEVGGA